MWIRVAHQNGGDLCLSIRGGTWEELSYSWLGGWCVRVFFKTTKMSSLWRLVKGVQWSSRTSSVEWHKGSWTKDERYELSYSFVLRYQP